MTQPVDALAARIKQLEERLNQLARSPQLHRSSIENGALREYDADGQLVGQYGRQWDGTHGAVALAGPTPPAPAGLTAEPIMGGIRYVWDGSWEPGAVAPMDFIRAELELSHDPDFDTLLAPGRIGSAAGGSWIHVDLAGTEVYARLRARATTGKLSDPSETVGPVAALAVGKPDLELGVVDADLLAAVIVLASVILTDEPTNPHVRIDNGGVASYEANPDGEMVTTSRFGGSGADRFLVTDPVTGETLAGLSEDGSLVVQNATIDGDPIIQGNRLSYLIGQTAGRTLGTGVSIDPTPSTSTTRGYFDVEFTAAPGRRYRIHTTPLQLTTSTTSTYAFAQIRARRSSEGAPTISTGVPIVTSNGTPVLVGGVDSQTLDRSVNFEQLFPAGAAPTVPTPVRVLLCYGVASGGGNAAIFADSAYPIQLDIDDAGPARQPLLNNNDGGGGGTTAVVTTQTLDFASTWAANWQSTSTAPRTGSSELIQGYTPYYTSPGSGVGQFGFGNLTGVLAGATINWMAVYIYATHWHNNSGGTALLGAHPYLNPPGSRPADWQLNLAQVGYSGKSGGQWIYIPSSWFAGFVSGANRGFTLGDLASTASQYYGRFAGDPSDTRRPVLRINFTR